MQFVQMFIELQLDSPGEFDYMATTEVEVRCGDQDHVSEVSNVVGDEPSRDLDRIGTRSAK